MHGIQVLSLPVARWQYSRSTTLVHLLGIFIESGLPRSLSFNAHGSIKSIHFLVALDSSMYVNKCPLDPL